MKTIEVDDEKRLVNFYEKRMSQEVDGSALGDEYAGYVFRCVPRRAAVRLCSRLTPRFASSPPQHHGRQ